MSPSVMAAAQALIAADRRFPAVPFRRYPPRLWRAFNTLYRGFAPDWWQELTVTLPLGGAHFRRPIDERSYMGFCTIPWARRYFRLHKDHFYIHQLRESRLFPFGDACDGNWWLFELDHSEDPHVHMLELTDWDGTNYTTGNGLKQSRSDAVRLFSRSSEWTPEDDG